MNPPVPPQNAVIESQENKPVQYPSGTFDLSADPTIWVNRRLHEIQQEIENSQSSSANVSNRNLSRSELNRKIAALRQKIESDFKRILR